LMILLFSLGPGVSAQAPEGGGNLPKKALEIIVANLRNDDSDVKAYAIETLGQTGNLKLIPVIKKYLSDANRYVQISSAKALWELSDGSGIKKLYEILNEIPAQGPIVNAPLVELKIIAQNKIREKALETLASLQGVKARDTLIELKNDNYGSIRDAAARELARLGFKEELEEFFYALDSKDEEVRYQTAQILSRVCPDDLDKIAVMLGSEKSIRVKMFLLDTVNCSRSKKDALEQLLALSDDKNPTLRYKAVEALGEIKSAKVFEKLEKIRLDTPDLSLKISAMKSLIENGRIKFDYTELDDAVSAADARLKRRIITLCPLMEKAQAMKYLSALMFDKDLYVQLDASLQVIKLSGRN